MKIFIWYSIVKCSSNYHEEGGLVVVAEDLMKACEAASAKGAYVQQAEEPDRVIDLPLIGTPEPEVFVFPQTGWF